MGACATASSTALRRWENSAQGIFGDGHAQGDADDAELIQPGGDGGLDLGFIGQREGDRAEAEGDRGHAERDRFRRGGGQAAAGAAGADGAGPGFLGFGQVDGIGDVEQAVGK